MICFVVMSRPGRDFDCRAFWSDEEWKEPVAEESALEMGSDCDTWWL